METAPWIHARFDFGRRKFVPRRTKKKKDSIGQKTVNPIKPIDVISLKQHSSPKQWLQCGFLINNYKKNFNTDSQRRITIGTRGEKLVKHTDGLPVVVEYI